MLYERLVGDGEKLERKVLVGEGHEGLEREMRN